VQKQQQLAAFLIINRSGEELAKYLKRSAADRAENICRPHNELVVAAKEANELI